MNPISTAILLLLVFAGGVEAQEGGMPREGRPARAAHLSITEDEIQWTPAPPSLPPGAQAAVLEGNPAEPGPFTLRMKLPANYTIPPHWHPADEHVTVMAGTFSMAAGEKWDEAALKDLPPGGFAVMSAGTRHYAMTKSGATLQLHGIGPWGITYVNPADDPRNAKPVGK